MTPGSRTWIAVAPALTLALVSACVVPSVYGIADDVPTVFDSSLLGTWYADGDTIVVASVGDRTYDVRMSGDDNDAPSEIELTVSMIELDGHRIIDVTPSDAEADTAFDRYGALFIPTHLFFALQPDGPTLRLMQLKGEWLEGFAAYESRELEMDVLTGRPGELRRLLLVALKDPDAWEEALELTRTRELR